MALKYAVIYGSVRTGRLGINAARFVCESIKARGHEAVLVDPKEEALPMLDKRSGDYDDANPAPENIARLSALFREVDGFIFVVAEYNHCIPPAMSNLVDHFNQGEFKRRPASIVPYSVGSFGGVRVEIQLRELVNTVGMVPLPASMPVPHVQNAFNEAGEAQDDAWQGRVSKFLDELDWYAGALKVARG